jgi:heat shock protein HslJ
MNKKIALLSLSLLLTQTIIAKRMNPNILYNSQLIVESMVISGKTKAITTNNTFNINTNDSTVNINLGCNKINTKTVFYNNKVSYINSISTRMGCKADVAKYEKAIVSNLKLANRYEKVSGKVFIYKNAKLLITLKENQVKEKKTISILNGSYRILQHLEKGEMQERLNETTTLTFDATNGTYTANMGCNTINGTYKLGTDQKITFTKGMMTLMGCSGVAGDIENAFLENLNNINIFNLESNKLMLLKNNDLIIMLERK